jgi:predicted ArsR family transcriptional regulator
MAEARRNITDPKALRALAHPLRWKLIEFIGREGTATATQCAEETGESVANCSYHLNTLAKYNYVEVAKGGQGREKPWRLVSNSQSWSDASPDPEAALAAQAASTAFLDYSFAQIKDRTLAINLEPQEWQDTLGVHQTSDYLTAAEVDEMREAVVALLNKYEARRKNPELRPEGARHVSFFLATTVAPDKH